MNAVLTRAVTALFLALVASAATAAEPTDVADLFPPGTIAYAEATNLTELVPQIAAVFKGTALEDSIPFVHKRKDAATTLNELQAKRELAEFGLLVSPEMLAEAKKLKGIAIGVTGFTDGGEPDIACVVLTGDSPAAGLAARAFLTMSTTIRKVGDVSKVPIFQYRNTRISYNQNGMPQLENDKPPAESPHELTFAYTPGLFVAGTGKRAVSFAIKRFLGEEKDGLSGTAAFKTAAATYRKTGVFYFVNFPELAAKMTAADKVSGGMGTPDPYAWLAMLVNPKSIKSVAGNVQFRDGGVAATMTASIDPAQKNPLWEFLSGPGVKVDLVQYGRRPALLAVAISLPEKDRAAAAIGLFDAAAKATGQLGRLPSDVVKEIEAKYKLSVADLLLAKTAAVTVVMPAQQELPKDARPLPMLVLHTADEATAAAWEEFFPKLFGSIGSLPEPPQPSAETIGGTRVSSLPGTGLPWKSPVHFARNGNAVALGLDRKLVAAAVVPDSAAAVAAPDAFSKEMLAGSAVLLGAVNPKDVLAALLEPAKTEGPTAPSAPNGGEGRRFRRPGMAQQKGKQTEEVQKSQTDFLTALGALMPTTFAVRRAGNELRIEVFQPKVQGGGLKAAIETGAIWLDKWAGTKNNPNNPYQMNEFPGG